MTPVPKGVCHRLIYLHFEARPLRSLRLPCRDLRTIVVVDHDIHAAPTLAARDDAARRRRHEGFAPALTDRISPAWIDRAAGRPACAEAEAAATHALEEVANEPANAAVGACGAEKPGKGPLTRHVHISLRYSPKEQGLQFRAVVDSAKRQG
jgi:hypothetical protein